jgi:thiamine transporter ThiT
MCGAELEGFCMIDILAAIAVIMRQLLRHMYEAGSLIKKLQAIPMVCIAVERYRYGMRTGKRWLLN